MKVKSISKIKSVSKRNPILSHRLQNEPLKKQTLKKIETKHNALTVREHGRAIKLVLSYYGKGITIENMLKKSLEIDIERAMTQLRVFYVRSFRKNIFTFTVKSSGLYAETNHQVELSWQLDKADLRKDTKHIFLSTPIKAQCSCGRFTYWYRYLWTKAKSCIGIQENRFPKIRNAKLSGMACKHIIRVTTTLHQTAFQNTFNRYVENYKQDKQTRLSFKDKSKIAGSTFSAK